MKDISNTFNFQAGNAAAEAITNKTGWFLGHFISPSLGLKRNFNVEVKWGIHKKGEKKATTTMNLRSTTLALLIRGKFSIHFPVLKQSVILEKEGDYVIFANNVLHSSESLDDSLIITVRWPSIKNDQIIDKE